ACRRSPCPPRSPCRSAGRPSPTCSRWSSTSRSSRCCSPPSGRHTAAAARRRRGGPSADALPDRPARVHPRARPARRALHGARGRAVRHRRRAGGLAVVNRAITAYRLCAGDPHAVGVTRQDARTVRVGYGTGELVFHGSWEQAIEVPPPRAPKVKREVSLMPQQGVAAVLSAGAPLLEAEELILRAGLDLEQGRERAAAVGLRAGLERLR